MRVRALGRSCRRCAEDWWVEYPSGVRCYACHKRSANRVREQKKFWHPEHTLYRNAKDRAKRKGVDFKITVNDIVIPERCPVLDLPLVPQKGKWADNSPTLDRLDPAKGYTRRNIRVISYRANRLKSDGSAVDHERIAAWQRKETQT